jgi:DNA mismatch repair protein MSH4
MISDKRIEAIESLIASSLNEENVQNPPRASKSLRFTLRGFETVLQTGIGAITVRVFAVKVGAPCTCAYNVLSVETRNPKANFNRLLDVARETFKENVADIYELGRELSETHGLPLALAYQDSGFIFQLKKSELEGEFPAEFINVTEKKGRVVFSTLDLVRWIFGLVIPLPKVTTPT